MAIQLTLDLAEWKCAKRIVDENGEELDRLEKGIKADLQNGHDQLFDDMQDTMKNLRQGKRKINYHTRMDLPTKEEVIKNFRLGICNEESLDNSNP